MQLDQPHPEPAQTESSQTGPSVGNIDSDVRYVNPADTNTRWARKDIQALYDLPFMDLLFQAQQVHREHHKANHVQLSSLLSIKTGACPEDCAYCPQSGHYDTGLEKEKLMPISEIVEAAEVAKAQGASRFCMGAAWRSPTDKDLPQIEATIRAVKALGMETCATLGMITGDQAKHLVNAGLDYYNHNLDTSEDYYNQIITTRTFQDRLDTLQHVRDAGMNVCAGGILGMGEQVSDRIGFILALANLPKPPESVPVNMLIAVPGTPLEHAEKIDTLDFVRIIAIARICMPDSYVRLSAGREEMSDETQALCFMAGANSVFYGDELLTANNASVQRDKALFQRLGMTH